MELEDRAAALLVLQRHLVQDVGQAGAGDDVLGVLGERLHLADDVVVGARGAETVDGRPVPVPRLNRGVQHLRHKLGEVELEYGMRLAYDFGSSIKTVADLIIWFPKEAVKVSSIVEFDFISV